MKSKLHSTRPRRRRLPPRRVRRVKIEGDLPPEAQPEASSDSPETVIAVSELEELALRFPLRWFPQNHVARICGFGRDVMTLLAALGAPILARKCNPHLLHKWLEANLDIIGKIRPSQE